MANQPDQLKYVEARIRFWKPKRVPDEVSERTLKAILDPDYLTVDEIEVEEIMTNEER